MKICKITRPPVNRIAEKFPQRDYHIFSRLTEKGHELTVHELRPVNRLNKYLSYTIGFFYGLISYRKVKADVNVADNIESGLASLIIRFIYSVPFVFDFIDDYSLIARHDGHKLRYHAIKYFEKKLPRYADRVIVVDEHKRRYCKDIGVPAGKLWLVPDGVDSVKFNPYIGKEAWPGYNHPNGSHILLFVGKVSEYYRLERMLRAMPAVVKKIPETILYIVGDGPHLCNLKNLSKELDIAEKIVFAGFRNPEQIPGFITGADVCLFPLPDSSALAIFEYMACGKPTVIPDYETEKMGIHNDLIPYSCIYAANNTVSDIAEAIIRLLSDKELQARIGREATAFVEKDFQWNVLALEYEKVLAIVGNCQEAVEKN